MQCPKCGNVIRPQDTDPGSDTARCSKCGVRLPFRKTFIETTELHCLKCGKTILPENVNLQTYLAHCRGCGEAFPLLDIIEAEEVKNFLENPPDGTLFERTPGGFRVSASTKSPGAAGLVLFLILFSGGALITPVLFLMHGNEFHPFIILIPAFLLAVSGIFWALALMMLGGKVMAEVDGDAGRLFVGVGSFGRRKSFKWSDISGFRQQDAKWHGPGCSGMMIAAEGNRKLEFGRMLDGRRRLYLLGVLRKMLDERGGEK